MLQESQTLSATGDLRWLGHLARLPNDRLPKRVLFGHMDGTAAGAGGRALKQWVDYTREDMQLVGLSLNWWRRI